MVPHYAKEIVFKYGLNRPEQFSKFYESLETLLNCAPLNLDYRIDRPSSKKAVPKNTLEEVSLIEASGVFCATLESSDALFDDSIDMILRYTGEFGKMIEFIVERSCYNLFIKTYQGHFRMKEKYVIMGNQGIHLRVLGRQIGDYEIDGLQGCHGLGGTLDNRMRTLVLASASTNRSHILAIGRKYSSEFKGISWHRVAKKWQSYISQKFIDCVCRIKTFSSTLMLSIAFDAMAD